MLKPKITGLPGHIQSIYVQNIMKLFTRVLMIAEAEDNKEIMNNITKMVMDGLNLFVQSSELEVQERVS